MTWCWIARLDAAPDDAYAVAELSNNGAPAGHLAAWPPGRKPVPDALRADARILDPLGAPAMVSLVLLDRDRAPLYDDPAVSGALRAVLAGPPPDAISTLVRDSSHFAGAVTVRRGTSSMLRDDPFARVGHAEVLSVGAGLFGITAPVPGPVTQRYAGKPWPLPRF